LSTQNPLCFTIWFLHSALVSHCYFFKNNSALPLATKICKGWLLENPKPILL
jgi:hypothetical protein